MRSACIILIGKPEGKRLLRRPRRRWDDNIRMGRREIGWEGVDWMHPVQDGDQGRAVVNIVMNVGKGKLPVIFLTKHHAVKAYWGSGGIAPHILGFGTRLR
jgi:hypothetical protein